MKRIVLFIATNMAVLLVLSVVLNLLIPLLGLDPNSYSSLLLIAALFGFGGSLLSLAMSKWLALRSVRATLIKTPRNRTEQWLLQTVKRQAQQAGIGMPDVAIYSSSDVNAFATGASRNNALVAVSTGLLTQMDGDEVEAVLAHEVSHIKNGDMVTMTLLQGVLNTFVIFFARVIASIIDNATRSNNQQGAGLGSMAYIAIVMLLELVFGVLASIIVMAFSRYREYRADAGSASLVGRDKMIAALRRLQGTQASQLDGNLKAFGIHGGGGLAEWFMSHPPLAKRIAALQKRL
ncbi:protease HtpX [Idiomarina xiamenensis]|uniref:Protease HtpX n=1 Tax=Idiomarina xiamenensis 10-D-4 TaxID=740709 RepID=K2LAY3_9GAMM|nr:protease HtpX [Idiomarina xiamenensis]EKE86975.1 heat shock protein HtpX [Idiomarina xiamenensis 10-D-4]